MCQYDTGMARQGLFIKQITCNLSSLKSSSPFATLLDACVSSTSARGCRAVHARVTQSPFASEVFIHNRLIDAYRKCGRLDDARQVFDNMPERNTFTWNYIVNVYLKMGSVDEAEMLFRSMPEPDQCSWNSMVAGLAQLDQCEGAMDYFVGMHMEGFGFDEFSFGSGLSVCARLRDLRMGRQVHGLAAKSRSSMSVYMGSALVDMYSKCGAVYCARRVFDGMDEKNLVSWNSLISCYEQNGSADEALEVFVRMMKIAFQPDEVTLASVVSACANLAAIKQGSEIHTRVIKSDRFRDDLVLCNALVDMYSKCNRVEDARRVFDKMSARSFVSETTMVSGYAKTSSIDAARQMFSKMTEKNVVSWNALIAGYTQIGENEEAVSLFRSLKKESVFPTHYTFGNVLNACANLADLQLGRQAHAHVLKHGFWFESGEESDTFVGNSITDMYMKCGSIADGSRVFETMLARNCVSWNALIVGYAQNGYGEEALELFKRMLESGQKPDRVTMVGALCACSHAGLVDMGRHYFYSMMQQYGLVPQRDHYTCMVDLLGRAGCLDEAKDLIDNMPMQPDAVVWGSLLAACRVHRNMELGEYAANKLMETDTSNSGPYVLLSNMYAELGKWKEVVQLRKLMRDRGVIKQPGCSWIMVDGDTHVFMVKDKRCLCNTDLRLILATLSTQMARARDLLNSDGITDPNACDQISAVGLGSLVRDLDSLEYVLV